MERKITFWLILFSTIFTLTCGGNNSGTEVENSPNPTQAPKPRKFELAYVSITITPLEGWTYTDYTLEDSEPGDDEFKDPGDPPAETLAGFRKGDIGFFTIFADRFEENQDVLDYIRQRFPEGEIDLLNEVFEDGKLTQLYAHTPPAIGPRRGFLLNMFSNQDNFILWMQAELLGKNKDRPDVGDEQMEETFDEFWRMVENATIQENVNTEGL